MEPTIITYAIGIVATFFAYTWRGGNQTRDKSIETLLATLICLSSWFGFAIVAGPIVFKFIVKLIRE